MKAIMQATAVVALGTITRAGAADFSCRTDSFGTTRCSDGTTYRTDSFGTTRDNRGNSWRTDSFGTTCRTDSFGTLRCNK